MSLPSAERFESMRPFLVRLAYRMLGQYAEAEDTVQDAFLRWSEASANGEISDDRAYLRTTVTRLCLDRLRSARARREVYVGPWLPEPVITEAKDQPEAAAVLADDISFALMLALERLAPLERAAFLLHDALGVPFNEVAHTLGRSEEAVRKLASRAREHVQDADRRTPARHDEAVRLRDALLAAISNDDALALQRILTEDVLFVSDGGGKVPAATVPVAGRERVTQLLLGSKRKGAGALRRIDLVTLNGMPGFTLFNDAGLAAAMAIEVRDGRIAAMYVVGNPDKLRTVAESVGDVTSAH